MAFVDDYIAWVIEDSAERNTRRIQREILLGLESWERESGAVFESSKTSFITLLDTQPCSMPLEFEQNIILPGRSVKVLGVIMDKGLRYKST